jgi:hypothetical protein
MEKIRIDFFDILGYLIPGVALLIACWIAVDPGVQSSRHIYQSIHNVDNRTIILGLFCAYVMGFSLHALGSFLFKEFFQYTVRKGWEAGMDQSLTVYEKWAVIREYGRKHTAILERWYALRAFSQNLCAACLATMFICFYKWFRFGYYEWVFIGFGLLLLSYLFMRRAKIFHFYLIHDMAAALKSLKFRYPAE